MFLPWAGYSRVSRVGDRKDTLTSHEDQRQRITAYAVGRGLEVALLPEESDISGGRIERPILEEALEGIEQGRYAGVMVAQLDRLSRMQLVDALTVIRRVEQAGGQVIAVAENFDAATPEGRLARNMFLSLAEMQLDRYKAQFARSKGQAVANGIWPCPVVPFGYRKVNKRLVRDEQTSARVVAGFEARAGGAAWKHVADELGLGLNTAAKVIRNPVYRGEIRYAGHTNVTAHEPLVPRDLWEAAQRSQPRPPRRKGARDPALLQGLARCASCGGAMTPNSARRRGRLDAIYRCMAYKAAGRCEAPASIAQPKLDAYVERLALEQIEALSITARQRSEAVESALTELCAAEAELDAYQTLTRVTDIGADRFGAGMRTRVEAVERGRAQVVDARLAAGTVPAPLALRELWPDLSIAERGQILRGAVGVVWVRPGRGPASERARVVAAGFEPPRPTRRERLELRALAWDSDLPGEIGPSGPQDGE